jgi:hypothetical protein
VKFGSLAVVVLNAEDHMQVDIMDLSSTMHAVDGDSPLSPRQMDKIVRAVLQAVDNHQAHRKQVLAEQGIPSGVSHELDERE